MLEIIPRAKAKAPSWVKLLLVFSLIILGGSIFSYFGLGWLQENTNQKITTVQEEMAALNTSENKALEKEIAVAQYQINNFSDVLDSHQKSSVFFDFLKSVVHPGVTIQEFNLHTEEAMASLRAGAKNFQVVGEQILALREEGKVKKVALVDLSLNEEGEISFVLDLNLTPLLFKAN